MRAALCIAAVVVAVPAVASEMQRSFATIASAPDRAGARRVALTVSLHTELQCGRVRVRVIVIDLPARLRLPRTVRPGAIRIGAEQPRRVTIHLHSLRIEQRMPPGVICASLAFGVTKIVLRRAAGIGNPAKPGRYGVLVHLGARSLPAILHVR